MLRSRCCGSSSADRGISRTVDNYTRVVCIVCTTRAMATTVVVVARRGGRGRTWSQTSLEHASRRRSWGRREKKGSMKREASGPRARASRPIKDLPNQPSDSQTVLYGHCGVSRVAASNAACRGIQELPRPPAETDPKHSRLGQVDRYQRPSDDGDMEAYTAAVQCMADRQDDYRPSGMNIAILRSCSLGSPAKRVNRRSLNTPPAPARPRGCGCARGGGSGPGGRGRVSSTFNTAAGGRHTAVGEKPNRGGMGPKREEGRISGPIGGG
ncbi:hypothetical protein C8Q80DRAFT_1131403 [Daedaleopsis nitida]|nr:hypothetical protein C8Q80DRAFT_1131403 [Daedaleopsis nitida]